jgi:dipeptidyl aminopeptidase/acylaminoacyl peptidase
LVLFAALAVWVASDVSAAEPADPRRPPAIQTTNVPVVPAATVEALRRYQSTRSASFGGWAPNGDGILVRTRFGNSYQLHRVYDPGGRRAQVTFYDEPVRGGFLPGEDGALWFSMSAGGNENDQLFVLDRDGQRVRRLTDGESRNRLGAISFDGSQIAFGSNLRNGRDTDLYVADPRNPDSVRCVFETDGEYWYAADFTLNNRRLLMGRYVSINESYAAVLDTKTGKRQDIALGEQGQRTAIGTMLFAPDDRSVLLTTDAEGEFRQLYRIDIDSGEKRPLPPNSPNDVEEVAVHRESGRIAYTVNVNGASRLYWLAGDQPQSVKTPLGVISGIEFSHDGSKLGFTLSRPVAPSDAYSVNLPGGELTRWTYAEVGGLDSSQFVAPRAIEFKTFDGRQIPAYYFAPKRASAERPAAVVVQIHGGPESQYRPYFSGLTQYLVNELGVAVIAPNVRGSRGYGKSYLLLDNGPRREDSVRDIGALLDWVGEQPELNAERLAVMGGSYGGYMVLSSLVNYPDRIRAGIDVVGIANFITFLENTADYRRDLRRAEYGDERKPEMRKVFERINPTANAQKIRSALLVAHGRNDPRVPFSEAEQIAAKVRGQGRDVWTVFADNEGHGFGKKDNRDYFTAVEILFLQTQLLSDD